MSTTQMYREIHEQPAVLQLYSQNRFSVLNLRSEWYL